jgi:predicted transcriptional regulator
MPFTINIANRFWLRNDSVDDSINIINNISIDRSINMSAIKTAISIDKELFDRVEEQRRQLGVSRSQFFAQAVEEYFHRQETQSIIEALNDVYGGEKPNLEEEAFRKQAGRLMAERLNNEDGGW